MKFVLLIALLSLACSSATVERSVVQTPAASPATTPQPDVELQRKIGEIAAEVKGKVGVSAVLIETGETTAVNSKERFPMQSVYKLPIAMAVMQQVEDGKLGWEQSGRSYAS